MKLTLTYKNDGDHSFP